MSPSISKQCCLRPTHDNFNKAISQICIHLLQEVIDDSIYIQKQQQGIESLKHYDIDEAAFSDNHDIILTHLKETVMLEESTEEATAVLISTQISPEQPMHLVLLAKGVVPAVWHYHKRLAGPKYWRITTLHSKRKLKLNQLWLHAVKAGTTFSHHDGVPKHIVVTVPSVETLDKQIPFLETELSTCLIRPDVSFDDLMFYRQGSVVLEVDARKMQIEFSIYDEGFTKLDSVAGSFSILKVGLVYPKAIWSVNIVCFYRKKLVMTKFHYK